jgi:AcrR family transcriptional regulator
MLIKKQSIMDVATQLFAQDGYHAVGIDRIITGAGVAKKTFYKHFPSKKKLIIAVLEWRASTSLASLRDFVEERGTPLARLQAVFDWHAVWFSSGNCTDGLFIAAITEFHHLDTDISSCSTAQKQLLTEFIAGIIEVLLDRTVAARTARQCVMLLDGALAAALVDDKSAAVAEAWLAMQSIIKLADDAERGSQTTMDSKNQFT